MTQYTIDIGAAPDDGQGDPLRTAFSYTNQNFDQVFAAGPVLSNVAIANNTIQTINSNGNLILSPNGIGKIQVTNTVIPSLDNVYDLGSPTLRFNSIYVGSGGLIITSINVTGNISANNFSASGTVSAVGNITGGYILGNGSQLTGITATYGNSNVATLLSAFGSNTVSTTGNITSGNLLTGGLISATGNITGGNVSTGVITLTNGAVMKDTAGDAVAVGQGAGNNSQGIGAVAIGALAGQNTQGSQAVAVGETAGQTAQGIETVAIGYSAGFTTQGNTAVAIGSGAGATNQGVQAVALGARAGQTTQGNNATAIGADAGYSGQSANATAVGGGSAQVSQGDAAVAVGHLAGQTSQGISAVAIGKLAGNTNQGNNSIILNATGSALDQTTANTFTVAPVRNDVANTANVMFYNATSKEITYGNTISVAGNITGNYFIGNGSQLTGIAANYGNANVVANLAALGSNPVSTTGNITGGNLLFGTGIVSGTGNITGNYFIGNGSQLTGISANTGNVTFSGEIVIGTGTSNVISGLYLAPSSSSANANMYLRVRGNINDEPTHIHFDTGNNAYYNQFIGDDNKYIQLANTGNIVINSNDSVGNSAQWTFDYNGILTLPGNSRVAPVGANIELQAAAGGYAEIVTSDGNNYVAVTNSGAEIVTSGIYVWDFNNAGNLTLPGNTFAVNYANGNPVVISGGAAGLPLANGTSNINIATANGNVTVTANATTWTFGSNSKITLPNGASLNDTSGDSVAFGQNAGLTSQAQHAVAIGVDAAGNTQGAGAVAIGAGTGFNTQGIRAVAIGDDAAGNNQGYQSVAIGAGAAYTYQGFEAVAIGAAAGTTRQGTYAVAIGSGAGGGSSAGTNYVSGAVSPSTTLVVVSTTNIVQGMVISGTGFTGNQTVVTVTNATTLEISASANSTPSGTLSFTGTQGNSAVAIGNVAGLTVQGEYAVAIGDSAGQLAQGTGAVAVGSLAGYNLQGDNAVAVGGLAGNNSQGTQAVAVGLFAGQEDQGQFSVAIGGGAGQQTQGEESVAIGSGAGSTAQGNAAVAIGGSAGAANQRINSVAIGASAGASTQGQYAVAIGSLAGESAQGNNSIILNATGNTLNQTTANTFTVAPVRNDVANTANVMFYNATSKEITYGNTISVAGNITGNYFIGNGAQLTGVVATSIGTLTSLSVSGNINAGNISVAGNITSGAINTNGNITLNNGFDLSLTSAAGAGGNITTNSTINAAQLSLSGNILSNANIDGNISTPGFISASGNVTGNFFIGNGRATTGILFSNTSDATTAGLTVDDFYLSAITALSVTNSGSLYYLFDQYPGNNPTIYATAGSTLAFRLAVAGHPFLIQSSGANYSTGLNHVTTAGTVTTAASAQGQVAGTLYWKIPGDVVGTYTYQCSAHGGMVGNIVVSSPTAGSFLSLSVTGNITGGNILFGAGITSGTGNITGGNILTGGLISATGNVSTGNLNITGNIVDTGALTIITGSNGNIALTPNGTGNVTTGANVSVTGNITAGNLSVTGNVTGNTGGFAIGYLNIPQVSLASNVTTALTDSGKHYYSTSASNLALTIANNTSVVWPVGTALSIVNRGTANITIAPGSGVSLYLAGNSTSANRTVTTYGMATVMNVAANIWMINGTVV